MNHQFKKISRELIFANQHFRVKKGIYFREFGQNSRKSRNFFHAKLLTKYNLKWLLRGIGWAIWFLVDVQLTIEGHTTFNGLKSDGHTTFNGLKSDGHTTFNGLKTLRGFSTVLSLIQLHLLWQVFAKFQIFFFKYHKNLKKKQINFVFLMVLR